MVDAAGTRHERTRESSKKSLTGDLGKKSGGKHKFFFRETISWWSYQISSYKKPLIEMTPVTQEKKGNLGRTCSCNSGSATGIATI